MCVIFQFKQLCVCTNLMVPREVQWELQGAAEGSVPSPTTNALRQQRAVGWDVDPCSWNRLAKVLRSKPCIVRVQSSGYAGM